MGMLLQAAVFAMLLLPVSHRIMGPRMELAM
jgi:hypothetical protein